MLLPDVHILVAAYLADDAPKQARRAWLLELANGGERFAVSELVLASFLRIVTNPRVFAASGSAPYAFVEALTGARGCVRLRPGPENWAIFTTLCRQTGFRGPILSDLCHAALAIEHDCEWVSDDEDFARVPGLRWRAPAL